MGLPPKIRLLSPSQAVEMLEERLPLLGLTHFHDLKESSEQAEGDPQPHQSREG